ncbi:sporulation protein YqfD (plasmid) [Bacillus sp. 31A1R]|uniref:Sporulation protein YqfD n=1 Tax=Robertmurraya mangrovi TaxID=3098077 RepID=A0ABU5IUV7_9BACI|nr:sporulation protein YqfD [Bacillus sp. 31A1R]MDZ5470943.1 sporulation protein YqfD [Bacillus sp. 31A1R]
MKNHWIHFFSGVVTVKVSGKGLERFLNSLMREEILIWHVKRHGTATMIFKIRLEDVHNMRRVVRNSDCKVEFLQRSGLPFFVKQLISNSGFLIGAALFFAVVLLLSNMVWGIEIKGANPATEYKIRKELDSIGVKTGQLQFFIGNPESIQRSLTNSIQEITWVGVELEGTTYHLQVVEKNEPEKPEKLGPRNIIAKKKAVIVDMFVEEGKPVVEVNDYVEAGDLLVSGLLGNEEETKSVSAKGKVYGETWYKSQVTLPLKSTFQVFNGNEKIKHFIKIGKLPINIWGFGKVPFSQHELEANEKKVKFLKWTLPVSYIMETYRESEKETRIYTRSEAIEVAKEMARKDIKNGLPEDASIKGEKVLHHSIENGKVNLSIHFQVIENIAEGQPIIQGDSE